MYERRKLIIESFKRKICFVTEDKNNSLSYEDLMVSNLSSNDQLKIKQDTTDVPALGTEEPAAQRNNQSGQGLEILTSNQMLSRFPITLAQLQAGKNLGKL